MLVALGKGYLLSSCFLGQSLIPQDLLLQPFAHSFLSKAILHLPFQVFDRTLPIVALIVIAPGIADIVQDFAESFT